MLDQRIAVAPSKTLAVALGAGHFAAACALWLAPVPNPAKAVCTIAIGASLVYFLARDALLHAPHSIVELEIRDDAGISIQTRRGDWIECDLLGSTYVSPHLTVVNCRPRGGWARRSLILVPDNVDPRDFRRLRMWLRWRRDNGNSPAPAGES